MSTQRKYPTADAAFAAACREFLKGCSCAEPGRPQECEECTEAFINAVVERGKDHGLVEEEQPTPEPLWRVMNSASDEAWLASVSPEHAERLMCAAELCAVRDWLYDKALKEGIDVYERDWLHRSLSTEADRAEAGE
jgi:hypothetical protein